MIRKENTGIAEDVVADDREKRQRTEVWLVRHGQSAGNAAGQLQGQADFPLTERGLHQAEAVAMRLRGQNFTALYSSDLTRALDTACVIGTAIELLVETDVRLREIALGTWSGLTGPEIAAQHAQEWEQWDHRRDPQHRRGGGESYADLVARVAPAISELASRHLGERIVVVAHGGTINAYIAYVLGLPLDHLWKLSQENACISRVLPFANPNSDPNSLPGRVLTLNDATHLDGVG